MSLSNILFRPVAKRRLASFLCSVGLAGAASAQPLWYVNDGIVDGINDIPVIDAINFVNNNQFSVFSSLPFTTSDTLHYTNHGVMNGSPGFDFATYPASIGVARRAESFYNATAGFNNGVINCSGLGLFTTLTGVGVATANIANLVGTSQMLVDATNIFNSGTINMDQSSLLSFKGRNVNLSRGTIQMNTTFNFFFGGLTNFGFFATAGLDGYWGVNTTNIGGNGTFDTANLLGNFGIITGEHAVTNRDYTRSFLQLALFDNFNVYSDESPIVNSNRVRKSVYLRNTNSAFGTAVSFANRSEIAVQWAWISTNQAGTVQSNFLFLSDTFGERTNLQVAPNGVAGLRTTYKPVNFNFSFINFDSVGPTAAAPGILPDFYGNPPDVPTNQYSAYEAIFAAATEFPVDKHFGDITNLDGRIEITADNKLNLADSTLLPLNTLILKAPNHYEGNKGAVVTSPYYVLNLHSTNTQMTISNLVPAQLPVPAGTCQLWSARWTNVDNANITNAYHVLVIDANMAPNDSPYVQSLKLVAPRLVLSDRFNVTRDMLLNTVRLTLTTNTGPLATSPFGEINFTSPKIVWSSALPRLQYLTNWGGISALNAVFFGGARTSPFFDRTFDESYKVFVNHGGITNQSSRIWADHFENTGTINSGQGAIGLRSGKATLSDGQFLAVNSDISIHARNLTVTNHPILSGGQLNLWVTNVISDLGGGATNGNFWTAADGFNLWRKPPVGDLLSTTVLNISPPKALTLNYWAGEDRGADVSGYVDNVAIGQLDLDGITNSSFSFKATGAQNAMYVDLLDLEGTAATIAFNGTGYFIPALKFDNNMTIYYAEALVNGLSVAEKINGANNGHLVWIPDYAGNFSTVTLSYTNTDGSVFFYTMNSALRNSTSIDSDGDGIVNAVDPTPLGDPPPGDFASAFSASLVGLKVALATRPTLAAQVSWNTVPRSTNFLYYKTSYSDTNWQTLTNFVYSGPAGRVTVNDPVKSAAPRYYRVRIDPPQNKK